MVFFSIRPLFIGMPMRPGGFFLLMINLSRPASDRMGPWERWDSAAQADQAKSEPPISRPAAQGGRDVWIATQPSDSEVTQGGHHPRAVSSADLLRTQWERFSMATGAQQL